MFQHHESPRVTEDFYNCLLVLVTGLEKTSLSLEFTAAICCRKWWRTSFGLISVTGWDLGLLRWLLDCHSTGRQESPSLLWNQAFRCWVELYSSSVDDKATLGRFLELQRTAQLALQKIKPLSPVGGHLICILRSSLLLAQSESETPIRAPRTHLWCFFHFCVICKSQA